MGSWFAEAVAEPALPARRRAAPKTKPRTRPTPKTATTKARPKPASKAKSRSRARARSGIVWIVVSGVLLAGVVFVNVVVLRLNLQLDRANQQQAKLHFANAALESRLSSQLASPRIQSIARHQDGLVDADPATIGYVDVAH